MDTHAKDQPSEEFLRFKEAVRAVATLTPEEQEVVKRKVAEEAKKLRKVVRNGLDDKGVE